MSKALLDELQAKKATATVEDREALEAAVALLKEKTKPVLAEEYTYKGFRYLYAKGKAPK